MPILSEEQFEEKYNLYSQELMNISYGYTKNRDDSLDVIQNVFFKYFNSNKSFPTLLDEKHWLMRVTINECIDLLRKKQRITYVDNDMINIIVSNKKNENENLYTLMDNVQKLPEKYRSVIILYYYNCLPVKEIMKILKLSESTIKKRLERARNLLKSEMEK